MSSLQYSRSMLGGSNKSTDPTQSFAKIAPLILNLITSTIGKGVDTIIGATKPSEATVTYFKAIGNGVSSLIWTPADGTLSVNGTTRTKNLLLGYERLTASSTEPLTISVDISVTLLSFPTSNTTRSEYLSNMIPSNNHASLPNGTEDGQTKQIILGTGFDAFIEGSFPSTGTSGYYLREPGNTIICIWSQQEGYWLLLNQAVYLSAAITL